MIKTFTIALFLTALLSISSCTENYSNGERIGMVTKFSKVGVTDACKSWEGHLVITQTGMNQSNNDFEFSVDNDRIRDEDPIVKMIDSAANLGWKVKLVYHETFGKNWFGNRGQTDHFITNLVILDRTPMKSIFGGQNSTGTGTAGIHDTIYVVIREK